MPIYEYQCTDCGHKLEAIQKMSDEPLSECPECSQAGLKKLVSAVGFRLKGNGWYETDFKSGGKNTDKNKNKKEAAPAPSCGAGGGCGASASSE